MKILAALLATSLLLDFIFYTGFFASDDIQYFSGIHAIAGYSRFIPDLGNTRLGVTLPDALLYRLTDSIAAVAWFHTAYHLILVILAYVLGRMLHGERTGLSAAALVAINPLIYVHAGAVLPDNAASCWLTASMIVIVSTQRRTPHGEGVLSWNRRRFIGYVIAGAMLGLCYTCKETALIMTIPAAILIISSGPLRNLVWIQNGAALAVGLVMVMVLDLVALRIISGDWIFRLSLVTDSEKIFLDDMARQGETPFARVRYAWISLASLMSLSIWLLAAGSVAYAFWKQRSIGLMAFFWWPLVYLTVGSTSLTSYVAPTIQARYYAILIVPAALMAAAIINLLSQRWRDRGERWSHRWGPVLAIVVLVGVVGGLELKRNAGRAGNLYRAREVRAFVTAIETARARYPEYPIVVSPYYRFRMGPVLYDQPEGDPRLAIPRRPPYVYIERFEIADRYIPGPRYEAHRLRDVLPTRSHGAVVVDGLRRMFGVAKKPRIDAKNERELSAVLFLVTAKAPTP